MTVIQHKCFVIGNTIQYSTLLTVHTLNEFAGRLVQGTTSGLHATLTIYAVVLASRNLQAQTTGKRITDLKLHVDTKFLKLNGDTSDVIP